MSNETVQTTSESDQPAPGRLSVLRRKANAALGGPQAADVSPDAGSSSLAISRVEALEDAKDRGVLFIRGGQLEELGSEAIRAMQSGGQAPEITADRLSGGALEAPQTDAAPQRAEAPAGDMPEVPVITAP